MKHVYRAAAYQRAEIVTARARAEFESSHRGLQLAQMRERCAELASQSFPSVALFRQLGALTDREREIGIAFAEYAVFGRTEVKL